MLLLYSNAITARSKYVFNLVFDSMGLEYQFTCDTLFFKNSQQAKINYSNQRIGDEFFINAHSLLFEGNIRELNVEVENRYETKILFPNNKICDLGFDIFSAVFYMVSRYEEYLPFTPDEYGRFKAEDTLAYKNNFLQFPVVDIWIRIFKDSLSKKFHFLSNIARSFKSIVTYDIDIAFKYKGRNLLRIAAGTAKDFVQLNLKNIFKRAETLFKIKRDPWDVYDYLSVKVSEYQLNCILFFLVGDKSAKDRNLNYKNPEMKSLLERVSSFCEIGLHPSYLSSSLADKFAMEKERLEKISGMKIIKSRQHFLKFNIPGTFNHLISAGITEDYSLGFSELPGFRAGTCNPFCFYDLQNEKETQLTLYPVTCMDVTFMNYLLMNPEDSLQNILKLINEVKNVNGVFISIWHNDSIFKTSPTGNWSWVHDEMVKYLGKANIEIMG
jgi:hypothetical protein